jgi:outer membrane cobalamin receptor
MSVVLDGVIMDQRTAFGELSPADVSSIEVLASPAYSAIYGEAAVGGIFIITTKHGGPGGYENAAAPGLAAYSFRPYYKARQFYSPQYTVKPAALNTDYRKTIYWQPDLVTGAAGKTSFAYFNAGTAGEYRVVVEGIDKYGRLACKVLTYKVE